MAPTVSWTHQFRIGRDGLGIGAGLTGNKSIVIHPRMDFMILAMDQIVNQASNWGFMLNSEKRPNVTIRSIINRGGGQGAQHSQALHSCWPTCLV